MRFSRLLTVSAALYFVVVLPINAMRERTARSADAESEGPTEIELLAQIRDELRVGRG